MTFSMDTLKKNPGTAFPPEAAALLPMLRLRDAVRLKRAWHRLRNSPEPPSSEHLEHWLDEVRAAAERSLRPVAERLLIEFPESLPIVAHRAELVAAIRDNPVVIVAGATGSGKTTQLPKMALMAGLGRTGRIGCTQPRRIAASSLARRLAAECGADYGREVGSKVRFDDRTGDDTVIKFMTDGILLAETRDDPDLLQYDCIILDEVHERSLNIDFLLGYLKKLLSRRRNLKLVIASATLEAERFAAFFDHAPFFEVEGRLFPIEDCYMPPAADEDLSENIARAAEFLGEMDPRGDILVFLPGEREIRDAAELLNGRRFRRTEILPLFGRLSAAEQNRIFTPGNLRRIILSTNVAETSLTIPGIRFVIDSGLVRLSRYNPRTRIQELRVETVSRASMRQRRGRCGRLADGICVHLYSENDAANMAEYTDPEIKRTALAGVILQMAALKLGPIEQFPLVDPPAPALIREGYRTLHDLGALDGDHRLTECGRNLARLPLDPHLGKMLEAGFARKVLPQITVIAAFLSIPDPRERPFEKVQAADAAHRRWASERSDFAAALALYGELETLKADGMSNSGLRRFAEKNFLNYRRLREWRNLVEDLREIASEVGWSMPENTNLAPYDYDGLHLALLSGLPRHLGCFDREEKNYFDMAGKRFRIFPGSGLARRKKPPEFLLTFALVETSQVFGRCCAEARPEWLETVAPWLCTPVYDQVRFDPESGFVYARERLTAGRLLIHPGRRRHYGPVAPAEARKVFVRDALARGLIAPEPARGIGWLEDYLAERRKLAEFERKIRRPEMVLDEAALEAYFLETLPEDCWSLKNLKAHWLRFRKSFAPPAGVAVQEGSERWLVPEDYPDELVFAGVKFPLAYRFEPGEASDGITLAARADAVNLLPGWALDYLVPGYLPEKLELWLKSLPRADRQKIQPLSGWIGDFLSRCRAGKLFTGQPLADLVSDVLAESGVAARPAALAEVRLPEYLRMKIAVLGEDGATREVLHEVPAAGQGGGSKLSAALPLAMRLRVPAVGQWPAPGVLPESAAMGQGGQGAYPALTAAPDGKVGVELYLKEEEAHYRHDDGLCALMRLQLQGLLTAVRRDFKLPAELEKRWFKAPGETRNWRDDLLDTAIRQSLGTPEERWLIRAEGSFRTRREAARLKVSKTADELLARLTEWGERTAKLEQLLKRVPADAYGASDLKRQMAFLFRSGFLRHDAWHEEYPRYLRGMELRLQRMIADARRDAAKGAELEPYLERFYLAAENRPELQLSPLLEEFWLLLEEARLRIYAPDVSLQRKCSAAVLEERWETLRY